MLLQGENLRRLTSPRCGRGRRLGNCNFVVHSSSCDFLHEYATMETDILDSRNVSNSTHFAKMAALAPGVLAPRSPHALSETVSVT